MFRSTVDMFRCNNAKSRKTWLVIYKTNSIILAMLHCCLCWHICLTLTSIPFMGENIIKTTKLLCLITSSVFLLGHSFKSGWDLRQAGFCDTHWVLVEKFNWFSCNRDELFISEAWRTSKFLTSLGNKYKCLNVLSKFSLLKWSLKTHFLHILKIYIC